MSTNPTIHPHPFVPGQHPDWVEPILADPITYTVDDLLVTGNAPWRQAEDRCLLVGRHRDSLGVRAVVRCVERLLEEHNEYELAPGIGGEAVVFLGLAEIDRLIEHLQGIRLTILVEG